MMDEEKPTSREASPIPEAANDQSKMEAEAVSSDAAQGSSNAAGEKPGEPDPFKVVEALSAENATLKDRLLRALAETENVRRRAERDLADARVYAVTSFARDMLTVVDNLRRALDALPPDVRAAEAGQGPLKAFVDGIELTERDFLSTLTRFGVKKIEPLGQKFDPNLHQAMFEIPDDSVPSGTVKQLVQPGFTIKERVLRPALVGVSKASPAQQAAG